ncbi:UNVERIFIED_CONTAM: hypothetical protein K2H54_003662 [Gekko kuhli]
MENPNKAVRGRRKENIPPHSSSNATPEQRNVQKNVNVNLFLDSFADGAVSRHSPGAAVPAPDGSRAAARRKSQVACVRGAKPHRRILVQTNLSCPYPPFWDTPGGVPGGCSRQQSNLKTKLGYRRPENGACSGDPSCLGATNPGPSRSPLARARSKSSPKDDFSNRSQRPRGGLGPRGVPRSCNETSQTSIGNKDPRFLKRPRDCFCRSEGSCRTLGTGGGPFCPSKSYERPSAGSFLPDQPLCPESPSRSLSSSPPGPGLTLDHLRPPASAESPATSATLQVLLSSSRVSAGLHSSIQRLQEEAASMGALSSFPWEPRPHPHPHLSGFNSWDLASGRPSATEQHAGEESCAKQASMKWRNSFSRDWGLGSAAAAWEEARPFGYGCRHRRLCVHSMDASDQFWPSAFYGRVGPTSLVCQGEEGCCDPAFCYLGCCSEIQQVLERTGPSERLKAHYYQKMLDAEELSSRFFHPPELGRGDTPWCRPSFDGLEVSLETLRARPPVTVGVTVDGTQREVCVTVWSPEAGQLGNGSENVDLCGLQDEPADVDGVLPSVQTMGEAARFLPACNSLEEIAGKRLGGTASGPKNSGNRDCWAGLGLARGEVSPTGKNAESSRFPHCSESPCGMDAVQKETLGRNDGAMGGERSRVSPQSILLLAKCFAAWRNRVFGKRAAARALYKQQLLRKGLGALKWAVELRRVQVGIAQQRHSRTVLAASFHRWQAATARQQKERASRGEMETHEKDSPASLGGAEMVQRPVVLRQLSAECLEAATQYGRAEGNLWLHLHRNQGVDNLVRKAQALRDMRRLAAAFRLWCLQKERLDEEESRAREACALLEKKRLRSAFETWRSHHRAAERILPLMAQIQRGLLSRCFDTWKGFAEREARGRQSRDRGRVGALRLCFQQWARMVQVRERARRMLLELLAQRQRTAYARFGFALNASKTPPLLNVITQSQRNGPDTLDGLYPALVLQEAFCAWKARWHQQQRLHAFRQTMEEKLLRKAVGRWRWRALCLLPLRRSPGDFAEEPLLASLDWDEFSTSSGFHSNTPALPASGDWLEGEDSLRVGSPASVSSLVTITDSGHLLHHLSPSPTPSPGQEDLGGDAVEFRVQASSPLRNQCSGKEGSVGDPFQALVFLSPECGLPSVTASSSSGEAAGAGGEEKEIFENQRPLLARYFALWSSRTLQNVKGKHHRQRSLLSWAFISWSAAAARTSERHKAQVWLESARRQRLLASCFERWTAELSRAQERREEERLRRGPAGGKAVWRWRKAVRGSRALRGGTGTVVQQSSNYWTKAATFHLCLRERSSLVRAPKFMKMPLSWPRKQRRDGEEGRPPSLAVRARLNGSASHVWLVVYRSQSSAAGPSRQGPPDSPGRAEWKAKHAEFQSSAAEMDSTRWLWSKYLRLWRRNVLLRRFREAWRTRHLVRAWLLWKDACRTEWVVQALARQRLAQWGWKVWRRRHLQIWVAEHFLEAQDRSLLKRAFGRWRHLAAERNHQPHGSFPVSQPLSRNTGADLTEARSWVPKDAETSW